MTEKSLVENANRFLEEIRAELQKICSDVIVLSDKDRDVFIDALENPPKPNKELSKLCGKGET